MRITDLTVRVVTTRSDNPLWNPQTVWSEKNVLLVQIETDSGLSGLGEAWCEGSPPQSTKVLIEEEIRPQLLGKDPTYIGRIGECFRQTTVISAKRGIVSAALSAVDIALWDLLGKECGQPIHKLLGATRDKVFAYASGGLYGRNKTPEDLGREMRGYIEQGFRGVKIKVGGAPLAEDVARVAAVRDAIGPEIRLMVDAVYSLSVPQAVQMARALEPHSVHFFEAPVSHLDHAGMAKVGAASSIPIAGNEVEFGLNGYHRLLGSGAVDVVHLDAILCGGISEAAAIGTLAAAEFRFCSFHSSSSAVAFAANLQVAGAVTLCDSVEWHMVHRLLFDHVPPDAFPLEDGYVLLPNGPGLGLDFSLEQLG